MVYLKLFSMVRKSTVFVSKFVIINRCLDGLKRKRSAGKPQSPNLGGRELTTLDSLQVVWSFRSRRGGCGLPLKINTIWAENPLCFLYNLGLTLDVLNTGSSRLISVKGSI